MIKNMYILLSAAVLFFAADSLYAGNPDRQGEAGAYELLMNPWARSAGLHTMNTANVTGVEALRLNVAGLSRINKTEVVIGHSIYLEGTDIRMNAFGLSQRTGKGAFGLSIMALDFGDIPITTVEQPEGTGATFSPSWFNIGLAYAHTFENKVSVGLTFRFVSETTSDLAASGMAVDAGVQYVTGEMDQFKFGISLRNIGTPMQFTGEGLSLQRPSPDAAGGYDLTYYSRSASAELPSVLNIGGSYDFLPSTKTRLTLLGNFTSNSFSQDQIGGGLEFAFNKMFMLRGGYKYDFGSLENDGVEAPIYTGVSAGFSLNVPMAKDEEGKAKSFFGIDYAYRHTKLWNGTHNLSIRFNL